jgi:transcriptional regulator with XRE-family HTH domain
MYNDMIYYVRLDRDVAFLPWHGDRGKKLQDLRESKNLTREGLAKLLLALDNASVRTIKKLETGKGRDAALTIEVSLLIEVCRILDASPSTFDYDELCRSRNIPQPIDI